MSRFIEAFFTSKNLACPVCDADLLPPDPNICEHIAFYWVLGPTDDPVFEFILPGYTIAPGELLDKGGVSKISETLDLTLHLLEEKDAYHPTRIILGIKQKTVIFRDHPN